jgi:ppGpp synthetase/RelA/SpoT-type nucleotidyltranferase
MRSYVVEEQDDLNNQFLTIRPRYEAFTQRLEDLLSHLLKSDEVKYHLIESRTKDVNSLCEKACRPGKSYAHPLEEITDLSGVRIILYYLDDVDRVTNLIRKEFQVDEPHSEDKSQRLKENEFGYLSIHFVVQLSDERSLLKEWREFAELKAEIQIRTVLQHAWAAISHALEYKSEYDAPKQLRRKLFRLSGLLELADEEFMDLRDFHDQIVESQINQLQQGNNIVELTQEAIAQYIETTDYRDRYSRYAEEHQCQLVEFCHTSVMEDYADLRTIAELVGINSLKELEQVLKQASNNADHYLPSLFAGGEWIVSPIFILEMLVLIERGSNLTIEELQYALKWDEYTAESVLSVAKSVGS